MTGLSAHLPKTISPTVTAKRGFTLAELAIVLGIIGVIFGSIWYAAGAVQTEMRVTQAMRQLNTIAGNMRAVYGATGKIPLDQQEGDKMYDTTMLMYHNGVFPSDMPLAAFPVLGATYPVNVWGGATRTEAEGNCSPSSRGSCGPGTFEVEYLEKDKSHPLPCANIASQVIGSGDKGLISVYLANSPKGWYDPSALDLSTIVKGCEYVSFAFSIKD